MLERIDAPITIRRVVLTIALLTLTVAVSRGMMFARSPEPTGLDGYFLAMEAKSLAERGYFENPTLSPAYTLAGLCAWLCSDGIGGVKLAGSLVAGLLIPALYLLLRRLGLRREQAVVPCLLAALSPSLAWMSLNYLANSFGLLAMIVLAQTMLGLYQEGGRLWLARLVCATGMATLAHPVAAVLALVLGAVLVIAIVQRRFRPRSFQWLILLVALGLGGAAVVFIFRHQLERFAGAFAWGPGLPLLSSWLGEHVPALVQAELSLYYVVGWLAVTVLFWRTVRHRVGEGSWLSLAVLVPVLFFPFWNLESLDMGYRLLLSGIPLGLCCLAFLLRNVPAPSVRSSSWLTALVLPLVVAMGLIYQPAGDPPWARYRAIVQELAIPADSLLIAHQGLNHVYTYWHNYADALNWLPDFPVANDAVWRIAHGVPASALLPYIPMDGADSSWPLVKRLGAGYVQVREDIWQAWRNDQEPELREALDNWYNPYRVRPDFVR